MVKPAVMVLRHGKKPGGGAYPDAGILDGRVIDELRNIGGSAVLFGRVLELFAGRVPRAIEQMTALSLGADLEALADAAHALKSMCANIGATRAFAACDALEHAARSRENFNAGSLVSAIIREVHQVMAEVDRLRRAKG